MSKKKVLGIFAHPDDEVLFGWPIFQSDEFEKHLIICCDDVIRRGQSRFNALVEVCKQENINLASILAEDNNFYALPTRRAEYLLTHAILKIESILEDVIEEIKPDYIFTHNPMGEYGHGSHRLLFEIVSQNPKVKNLLFTDICQESNHRSHKEIPDIIWDAYYEFNAVSKHELDEVFYYRCREIYNKHNAWTWNKDPIKFCHLYLLKEENGRKTLHT